MQAASGGEFCLDYMHRFDSCLQCPFTHPICRHPTPLVSVWLMPHAASDPSKEKASRKRPTDMTFGRRRMCSPESTRYLRRSRSDGLTANGS